MAGELHDEEVAKCLRELNNVTLRSSEEFRSVVVDYFISKSPADNDDSESNLESDSAAENNSIFETESDTAEPIAKRPRLESTNKVGVAEETRSKVCFNCQVN